MSGEANFCESLCGRNAHSPPKVMMGYAYEYTYQAWIHHQGYEYYACMLQYIHSSRTMNARTLHLWVFLVSFPDPPRKEEGSEKKTLLGAVQLECHGFWIQQTSSFRSSTWLVPLLLQFSKFLCSTVYLLPVISWTRTLIGWTDVLSLINTCGSIPTIKTLPGIVICQTLPTRFSFPRFCNWGAGEVRARWRVWGRDYGRLLCMHYCNYDVTGTWIVDELV